MKNIMWMRITGKSCSAVDINPSKRRTFSMTRLTGYYYLYVSYGTLTSSGGYQVRVFRSKTVDGDYVDMNGEYPTADVDHQLYGLKLTGNYKLPSLERAYMATGHNSAFIDEGTADSIWSTIPVLTTARKIIRRAYIRC